MVLFKFKFRAQFTRHYLCIRHTKNLKLFGPESNSVSVLLVNKIKILWGRCVVKQKSQTCNNVCFHCDHAGRA